MTIEPFDQRRLRRLEHGESTAAAPRDCLILRLRGLFLCGVLLCSRGSTEAEEASTASTAAIMECCKRTALSRPGRTTTLSSPQIGWHHKTLRC